MPDLDTAIRARLDEWQQHRRQDGTIPTGYGYDEMRAAITAVLDEHKPRFEPYGYRPGGETVCSAETSVWGEMNQDTPYPCDTVSLIAKALGIEVRP